MADALEAALLKPEEATSELLSKFDLIGFGSGIYYGKHHKSLLKVVNSLPTSMNKKAFVFSTAGVSDRLVERNLANNHKKLRNKLEEKGFRIVGEFSCCGFMTWGYYRLLGGRNNNRPDENDLKRVRDFAEKLKTTMRDSQES